MERFGEMAEEEYKDIKKVFLAEKSLLICESSIEIFGQIMEIDNYWIKYKSMEQGKYK
jgi:hypothetical protein